MGVDNTGGGYDTWMVGDDEWRNSKCEEQAEGQRTSCMCGGRERSEESMGAV